MKEIILKKENGVVSILEKTEENMEKLNDKHLCATTCSIDIYRKCQKVFGRKRLIRDYDFITDGYQIFDGNSKLVSFCVNKCKNCKEVYEAKPTAKEEIDARQKRNELMKAYFGTMTIEEACRVQDELIMREDIIADEEYSAILKSKTKKKIY